MNRKSAIRWLYSELPDLVSRGVLTPEAAQGLKAHYGEAPGRNAVKTALVIFSILGALLIGGGVILLIAHNWEELGRPLRAALSVAPLLATQALALWASWTGRRSAAWREGTATGLMLAVGASIALVSQTYHIAGEPADFMLTWMLLALPLVYILDASAPAALYWAGVTEWAGIHWAGHAQPVFYWLLMALALPHFILVSRENRYAPRPVLLGWVLALCLTVGTGLTLTRYAENLWILAYAGLFGILYLAGSLWQGEGSAAWQTPFRTWGATGAVFLAWLFSFHGVWGHAGYWHSGLTGPSWADEFLLYAIAAAILGLGAVAVARRAYGLLLLGAMPLLAAAGFFAYEETVGAVLFNLYLLAVGVVTVVSALRARKMGLMNLGLLVLSVLLLSRFFDSDLSFLFRGVAFIVVGLGFLGANIVMAKKAKGDGP